MAPKGGNAKKESGRAKKAENEANKKVAALAEKERKEADTWKDGARGKSNKDDKEEKRKADLARKAENARLLAEEEAAAPAKVKPNPKAGGGKPVKVSQVEKPPQNIPGAAGANGAGEGEVESFSATGIDNALDLLEVVTAKMDKASVGQQAAGIEKHPERRFKAAYAAYEEREMPNIRADHPGLRLQQYKDLLYKQFQKSPENPFNQSTVAYDATKEEKVAALKQKKEKVESRLRDQM